MLQALEKEPSRRYQHASEVKQDVDTISSGPGSLPPRLVSKPAPAPSPPPAGNATSDKTILPVFLLAFFLGPFGVHRFYVGKIGTGLLQLGTLGLCGIWTLIDWILILCSAFTDGKGRRITEWMHPQPDAVPGRSAQTGGVKSIAVAMVIVATLLLAIVLSGTVVKKLTLGWLSEIGSQIRREFDPPRPKPSAGTTYGSGKIATETYGVEPFSKIELHDSGDLEVEVLPKSSLPDWPNNCITVTTDDNVQPLIVCRTQGDTLTIHSPKPYRSTRTGVKVRVVTPYLDSLTTFSSGNVQVTGLDERNFKMKVNASSDAVLQGRVDEFYLVIMGSGDVHAEQLAARDLKAVLKGSGDGVVRVTNSVSVDLQGSGDLIYHGRPATVEKNITGSGSLRAR